MTKIIIFLLVNSLVFPCFSQPQLKEYNFKPFPLLLKNRTFNLVEVVDNREFPNIYGSEMFLGKEFKLINTNDLSTDIFEWFNNKYPIDPKLPNIALKIQSISFTTNRISTEEIGCTGLVNIYLKKEGKYTLLSEFTTTIYGREEHFPYSIMHSTFSDITPKMIDKAIISNEIIKIESPYNNSIVNSKPGIYRHFEDFKNGVPSKAYTNKYFELFPKNQTDNFRFGEFVKKKYFIDRYEIEDDFWGFSDGQNIFMKLENNLFVKIKVLNDKLYFNTNSSSLKTTESFRNKLEKTAQNFAFDNILPIAFDEKMTVIPDPINKKLEKNIYNGYTYQINKLNGLISYFNN